MRRLVLPSVLLLLIGVLAGPAWADDDDDDAGGRQAARRFVTLPDGVRFPEGIAANPDNGDIFVGTFAFPPDTNKVLRFRKNGRLAAQRDFGGTPLLGLAYRGGKVYIANAGALVGATSKIQRIAANFGAGTGIEDVAIIPSIGAPPPRTEFNPDGSTDMITFGNNAPAPNALTFDSDGNLYVSDSFQGAIFRIANAATCATPCAVTTFKHDGLLATAGFPPFGANGLALNAEETDLFIANTGDDRVLRMEMVSGNLSVFAESINGADGMAFDGEGRLVVAANQADELVVVNNLGRVVAKLGDFLGIRRDRSPRGLLFPASLAIVKDEIFVTNLALVLDAVAGNEPEEDVTRYTISRIHIPKH